MGVARKLIAIRLKAFIRLIAMNRNTPMAHVGATAAAVSAII